MKRFRVALRCAAAVLALTVLPAVAAGCGDDDDDAGAGTGGGGGDGGTQTLRVTSLPILDAAPYFWALDTGLFEERGLEIKDQTSAGGAADLPALVSGDLDIVYSNTVSTILGRSKGLPIKMIAATNENQPTGEDYTAVVTAPGSNIKSPKDLEGKKLAVNTLENINHIFERKWLADEGVDPESVEYIEVPFPDQPVALERGRIDATLIVPPFLQSIVEAGGKVLGHPYQAIDRVVVAGFITTDSFIEENEDAVDSFTAALTDAVEQIQDPANEDRLLEILAKRTKIDRKLIASAVLPVYAAEVDKASMQQIGELMREQGVISSVPDMDEVVR